MSSFFESLRYSGVASPQQTQRRGGGKGGGRGGPKSPGGATSEAEREQALRDYKVTIEYKQESDRLAEPGKTHTVVISSLHAETLKAVRTKEYSHQDYNGAKKTTP